MITIDLLITKVPGLQREDVERWISNDWVRADGGVGETKFRDIDVARVRLIHELRSALQVNEEALPIVLSLLDQLYDQRRRMRELSEAICQTLPDEMRRSLAQYLGR